MRVLVSASGIQEYIFEITQKAASTRLRGRSARLGLVLDLCLQRLNENLGNVHVLRNAGSRLDIEFDSPPEKAAGILKQLQLLLDAHSRDDLDAQVWFNTALGITNEDAYRTLDLEKLNPGKAVLQEISEATGRVRWKEENFVFSRKTDERKIQREERDEATSLPEAVLGRILAHKKNEYFQLTADARGKHEAIPILDQYVHISEGDPGGYRFKLGPASAGDSKLVSKRLCRYAPVKDQQKGALLDLSGIAERSIGASFLGVLKADLDDAGTAFRFLSTEQEKKKLSDQLEVFFTDGLQYVADNNNCQDCYVVYSGGDDMFLLGPWDQLIRFAIAFRNQLREEAESWSVKTLSLSAGFKLTHPGSPIRYLADEAEYALKAAKGYPGKDRFCVFERVLAWNEVSQGVAWAQDFIRAATPSEADKKKQLSSGFLQHMQFYADESRRYFEDHKLAALRMVPLLQNDWARNKDSIGKDLRERLEENVLPLLLSLAPEDKVQSMWRIMDFASRYASYGLRKQKGEEENGQGL